MPDLTPHKFPKWAPQVGVAFFAVTVVFLMALVFAGVVYEKRVPDEARFLVVAILALTVAIGGVFIGGNAVAEGRLKLPGAKDHPMSYSLTGGVAVFGVLLLLGMNVYAPVPPGDDGGGTAAPAGEAEGGERPDRPDADVTPPNGTDGRTDPARQPDRTSGGGSATYETVALQAGFSPDPYTVAVLAGGASPVDLGGECRGYVHTAAPDVDLHYQAAQYQLAIYASAQADITLIVNGPDGQWSCSDDYQGTNPALVFPAPMSGRYDIWLGTYDAPTTQLPQAMLYISEMAPRW